MSKSDDNTNELESYGVWVKNTAENDNTEVTPADTSDDCTEDVWMFLTFCEDRGSFFILFKSDWGSCFIYLFDFEFNFLLYSPGLDNLLNIYISASINGISHTMI